MKKTGRSEWLATMLFMTAVTAVCIGAVAGLHLATANVVAANESLFLRKAVRAAAGLPATGASELNRWWAGDVEREVLQSGRVAYRVRGGTGGSAAVVLEAEAAGLWGRVRGLVGFSGDGKTLTGVAFTEQNETPGLGARIEEAWFVGQFRGKTGPFSLVPEGTGSAAPTEIDAITGATITSSAVRDLVNGAIPDIRGGE
ncbi:MAG: FMN-binding protein [Lentisphaerae bacterium]|nr:FMN-binding protein [Lentisphaerota bacterium]